MSDRGRRSWSTNKDLGNYPGQIRPIIRLSSDDGLRLESFLTQHAGKCVQDVIEEMSPAEELIRMADYLP